MHSLQQIVICFFALFAFAFAQYDSNVYDSTVYITSTVYRVNTVTLASSPSARVVNQTSTISATRTPSYPTVSAGISAVVSANGTVIGRPSATGAKPSSTLFTGAASALTVNAYVAALAAGLAYLVL